MNKPKLLIMAAGMGSRYGGLKQIEPVDDNDHLIIDYSMYDALKAGFGSIICVIRRENEEIFEEKIGRRVRKHADLTYAYQDIGMLPIGYSVPEGRVKPWGTGHAVLCAREQAKGAPVCVINSDDFYGLGAFEQIAAFLSAPGGEYDYAMCGYRVENTLTENGYVSRGVCSEKNGFLTGITERTHVEPREGGAAFTEDGEHYSFLPAGTPVSMNMWGFRESIFTELETRFPAWLDETMKTNPLKGEYFLPLIPNMLLSEGKATVRVLPTAERWYGVTYKEDKAAVTAALLSMRENGIYPAHLWD